MTPGARVSAAIEVLEQYLDGQPVEKALTNWSRRSRFAGSKDRAAIRDIVFDAVRNKRRCNGGSGSSGARTWIANLLIYRGISIDKIFDGQGHSPKPLDESETGALLADVSKQANLPDWVADQLIAQIGPDRARELDTVYSHRAPIGIRANNLITSRDELQIRLAASGIETKTVDRSDTALIVTQNERRLQTSDEFQSGLFEIQDPTSQAVADMIPVPEDAKVLDYCAGGGGKTLAMAARANANWFAHDASQNRLKDLGPRSKRAGIFVKTLLTEQIHNHAPFDVVVCDVPCSGSGAWRRSPDGMWSMTSEKLVEFQSLQREICKNALSYLHAEGLFAFVTCSIFPQENQDQVEWLCATFPSLKLKSEQQWYPDAQGDGLFCAIFEMQA